MKHGYQKIGNNTHLRLLLTLMALFLVLPQREARAALTGSNSVKFLADQADLVVRGRVVSVEPMINGSSVARIAVDLVIKSKTNASTNELAVTLPIKRLQAITDDLTIDEYALFFLKKEDASLVPVDETAIEFPIREGRPDSSMGSNDLVGLLRQELLFTANGITFFSREYQAGEALLLSVKQIQDQVQRTNKAEDKQRLQILRGQYIQRRRESSLPVNVRAIMQLKDLPAEERTLDVLKTLLVSAEKPVRGAAAGTLLFFKQLIALQPALTFIATHQFRDMVRSRQEAVENYLYTDILSSVGRVEDASAIDVMGKLVSNKNPMVRRAAVESIRSIGKTLVQFGRPLHTLQDAKTIPYLMQALEDEDFDVRLGAVWALAEITSKREWYPSYNKQGGVVDKPEETKVISRWKQWWEQEGKAAFEKP